jgi:hypothetical protein
MSGIFVKCLESNLFPGSICPAKNANSSKFGTSVATRSQKITSVFRLFDPDESVGTAEIWWKVKD